MQSSKKIHAWAQMQVPLFNKQNSNKKSIRSIHKPFRYLYIFPIILMFRFGILASFRYFGFVPVSLDTHTIIIPRHQNKVTLYPQDNFSWVPIVLWDPLNAKRSCPKKRWYGLFGNVWFLWQPLI